VTTDHGRTFNGGQRLAAKWIPGKKRRVVDCALKMAAENGLPREPEYAVISLTKKQQLDNYKN
jgi:hypothetical protein